MPMDSSYSLKMYKQLLVEARRKEAAKVKYFIILITFTTYSIFIPAHITFVLCALKADLH